MATAKLHQSYIRLSSSCSSPRIAINMTSRNSKHLKADVKCAINFWYIANRPKVTQARTCQLGHRWKEFVRKKNDCFLSYAYDEDLTKKDKKKGLPYLSCVILLPRAVPKLIYSHYMGFKVTRFLSDWIYPFHFNI